VFQRGRYGLKHGKEEGRLRLALFLCVDITMPKGPFLPSDFTTTKFSTVADKAESGNTLLRFIESERLAGLLGRIDSRAYLAFERPHRCFGCSVQPVKKVDLALCVSCGDVIASPCATL
jgi:hypothetical protein